jgi:hypothetical protein
MTTGRAGVRAGVEGVAGVRAGVGWQTAFLRGTSMISMSQSESSARRGRFGAIVGVWLCCWVVMAVMAVGKPASRLSEDGRKWELS